MTAQKSKVTLLKAWKCVVKKPLISNNIMQQQVRRSYLSQGTGESLQ